MKQLLLIASILFSVSVNAQAKKDTTVKKEPMDTSYVLVGKFPDFQLLYKGITSPGDITPNQLSALAAWIQKIEMLTLPKKKN